jgi:uncharacterized repeat protein (TIGR02543 family)
VTFDATTNGGQMPSGWTSPDYYDGQPYGTLPPNIEGSSISKYGFEFKGWYTDPNVGAEVSSDTIVSTAGNHTLYAHWNDNTIVLTFDGNGGDFDGDSSRKCVIGQPVGELPRAEREGYNFNSWWTGPECAAGQCEIVTASTLAPDHDTTIYAGWLPIVYTVRFNANGGNSGSMGLQPFTYDVT